jgi:hypothetical protein
VRCMLSGTRASNGLNENGFSQAHKRQINNNMNATPLVFTVKNSIQ